MRLPCCELGVIITHLYAAGERKLQLAEMSIGKVIDSVLDLSLYKNRFEA